jgi:hypothetical protein
LTRKGARAAIDGANTPDVAADGLVIGWIAVAVAAAAELSEVKILSVDSTAEQNSRAEQQRIENGPPVLGLHSAATAAVQNGQSLHSSMCLALQQ